MMKQASELNRITNKGLKPLPEMSVSEWADNYRMLSSGISAEPGRYKTSRAPYQREVMDSFTQPGIWKAVAKFCSQSGKSELLNNIIARFAHLDPCTIMMIQPTVEMAEDFSKSRISPMIRDTPSLSKLFFDVKSKSSNNTILSKIFPGGRLIMCGANSPAGLASRPIRILLADEVDRFPDSAGTEGDPVDLAAKRTTTFWNRCIGLFSTPTNEGASRIEDEYQAGTQEEWQHECPGCGEFHLLRYIDMTVDYEESQDDKGKKTVLVHSVKWRCPDCGHEYEEMDMRRAKQKYIAQNPKALANGCRSFFVNCFSSPWIEWKTVMREWLEAKGDPAREKVVVNTRFGEVYREPGAFEDEAIFLRRREKYGAELPEGVLLLTAAVDVQDNRLEYEICGWGMEGEAWGINKGIILGAPNKLAVWQELDYLLDKTYTFANGKGLNVFRTFIDSGGHFTTQVYEYCQMRFAKQRFAVKGVGGPGVPLNYKVTRPHRGGIPLSLLGVDGGKQEIMNCLAVSEPGPRYFHFPLDEPELGLDGRGYDDVYFKGIISEHKKTVKRNGIIRQIWETTQGVRNEPLDLRVYNLAAMKSCHFDWNRLYEAVTGLKREPEVSKEAAQTPKREINRGGHMERPPIRKSRQMNIWG